MVMQLADMNEMELNSHGVFQAVPEETFNYSDGEETEQLLAQILSTAKDLSSDSLELQTQISDWPTEYHLSSSRANLLRPLNLEGVERVLELGCGCGSISRYLGEQQCLKVDAVEGSPSRAALAAMRCKGQDNVTIHTGNFNQMVFPESGYDLVLFVGVTEYAGRFSEQASDQAALQDLLSLAKSALKPGGVALIAIENRLGLKYLMGACEDHYGKPWVGLNDYPETEGIRTYSKSQWLEQIDKSEFKHSQFCLPFPDYKVPTALINEGKASRFAIGKALDGLVSRDYLRPFRPNINEARLWQGVVEAGALSELSNSFLILLGDDAVLLNRITEFDTVAFDSPNYDWHVTPKRPNNQSTKINDLQQQLAAVTEHNQQLAAQLDLLNNSRGLRFLSKLKRLFFSPR